MNTDVTYLRLLDEDLRRAAAREGALRTATPPHRRRSEWGRIAAAILAVLVLAGGIGWIVNGRESRDVAFSSASLAPRVIDQSKGAAVGAGTAPAAEPAPAAPGDVASGGGGSISGGTGNPGLPQTDISKIIRNGSMAIEVPHDGFEKGFAAVTRIAINNGGLVMSSSTQGETRGTLTLRIPASRFDEALVALRQLGTVESQSVRGQDVTAQFIDLQARLRISKARRAALVRLMQQATTIADTLTLQNALDDVQLRIEEIQGQLRYIQNQAAESTVRVSLREKGVQQTEPINPVKQPSLGTAFDRAIQGFLNVVSAVVIGLGYLIPIGFLALLGWSLTLLARRHRAVA